MTTALWSKDSLFRWHESSIPLGHETLRPQAARQEPGRGMHTFCWQRPAGPGVRPCAAPPRPWGGLWGVLHAPPPCTPDTWQSRRTGSKSPSPAGDTRAIPGLVPVTECRPRTKPSLALSQLILTASPGCGQYYIQFHRRKGKINVYVPGLEQRWIGLQSGRYGHKTSFSWPLP